MPQRSRSSHEQKTPEERRRYFDTTVRGIPTPTVDEDVQGVDSTESTLAPGPDSTHLYRSTTKPSNPRFELLREHWIRVVAGLILVPLGAWAVHELYTLNREVGEIRIKVDGAATAQQQFREDLEHVREQMRQEMDRINDRLDRASKGH